MDRAERARTQWDTEIPGLELGPMVLLGRLGEAAQLIAARHLEPVFAAHGLKRSEFDVLATLRRSGEPFALTPTELYSSTMITSGAMTARLDRLEKAGLIERRRHASDRRALMAALTPKGKTLIEQVLPLHVAAQTEALKGLSQREQETLSALLGKLVASLGSAG